MRLLVLSSVLLNLLPFARLQAADLIISNGNSVSLSTGTFTYDILRVETGGTLLINGAVQINAASLEVQSGATIDGKGRGYVSEAGPGAGASRGNTSGGGGGHAGSGGVGVGSSTSPGGGAYDSVAAPLQPGSGGGMGQSIGNFPGGSGGAALHLILSGAAVVEGSIDMGGDNGSDYLASGGGGAGGALWLEASSLSGNGSLSAAGGSGGNGVGINGIGGGGGSGGFLRLDPAGNCSANSLAIGYADASAGSAGFGTAGNPGNGASGQRYDSCPAYVTVHDAPTVTEGDSGTQNAIFSLTLSTPSVSTVSVDWHTVDISATAGSDYVAQSGTTVFVPGETAKNVTVVVLSDTKNEGTEDFGLSLTASTGAPMIPQLARAVILDNDPLPSLAFSTTGYSANEDAGAITVTVNLSPVSGRDVSVHYNTSPSPFPPSSGLRADDGTDFSGGSGTLIIPAGASSGTIVIGLSADSAYELDEQFLVNLSAAVNATGPGGIAAKTTCTIYNDDTQPAWTLVREGDDGPLELTEGTFYVGLKINLGYTASSLVSFIVNAIDGRAINGHDFNIAPGLPASIPNGYDSFAFNTHVLAHDGIDKGDRTFDLDVLNVDDYSESIFTVTIHDIDHSAITVQDQSVTEGDSGTVNVSMNLTLSCPNSRTVTVEYALLSGTAQSGVDYLPLSGTATFSPLSTSLTLTVQVVGDLLTQGNRDFSLQLSNPVTATLQRVSATVHILDNDSATPTPTFTPTPFSSTTATPTASPSATRTVTPSPTHVTSPVNTPTPAPTQAFAASSLAGAALGPVPVRKGEPLCFYFTKMPESVSCNLSNSLGETVSKLAFGADLAPCAETGALAPGMYWGRIKVRYADGTEGEGTQKVVVVR